MLRARLSQCTRTVASTSSAHSAHLHTTAALRVSHKGQSKNKRVLEKEAEDLQRTANRPHVVLGHRPGDEAKWTNCDLARVIVTEADVDTAPVPPPEARSPDDARPPPYMNFGVGEQERELLFDVLPNLSIEGSISERAKHNPAALAREEKYADAREAQKAVQFARLVALRNANAKGILFENKRRIVAAFSESEDVVDTGRPEVQAAIYTVRIRAVWNHLMEQKKDFISRQRLRELVHKRAKVLRYLKRVDIDRYERCLERIGVEPESVEGELVV